MRPADDNADSKIAQLLPRIVERAARRSDEKDEEPFAGRSRDGGKAADRPAVKLRRGTFAILLLLAFWPAALGFLVTGLAGKRNYVVTGANPYESATLQCVGAPLVHSQSLGGGRMFWADGGQFFPGALLADGLLWLAVAAGWSFWLWAGIALSTAWKASGRRQFTVGELLALTVGVAITFAAARWDWQLGGQAPASLKLTLEAIALDQPVDPKFQSLSSVSIVAAPFAYVGIGGAGAFAAWFVLWLISQFLPRRPGEDKPLLQQIF